MPMSESALQMHLKKSAIKFIYSIELHHIFKNYNRHDVIQIFSINNGM